MQKERSPALDRTACNCLALRQAARHVSQLYDSYLASEGLRTTLPDVLPLEACYLGWQESLRNLAKLVEPEINQ